MYRMLQLPDILNLVASSPGSTQFFVVIYMQNKAEEPGIKNQVRDI